LAAVPLKRSCEGQLLPIPIPKRYLSSIDQAEPSAIRANVSCISGKIGVSQKYPLLGKAAVGYWIVKLEAHPGNV
jgi:hypothetical protein